MPLTHMPFINRQRGLLATFALLLFSLLPHVQAEESMIELKMPNGMTSLAEFNAGDKSKPVALILHGFLQTSGFSTIQRLADTLISSDYPVLSPSLSLGIDRRKTSLSCDAIHLHNLDEETEEVRVWVNWLQQQGYEHIVLVGHSFGSLQLLAHQYAKAEPSVKGLILTSLVYADEPLSDPELKQLQQMAQQNATPPIPQTYSLTFCQKYPTLPQYYWSYIRWNKDFTTQALQQIKVPVYLVMGTQDNRIDSAWMEQLLGKSMNLYKIEGASHFFDAEHEFDLHILVEEILEELAN